MSYDAILLTSFGGPEGPDDVMPYLERVTAGRGIPRERLEEVSHHYLALGGVSPINEQNRALLAAMRGHFPQRGIELPIYWGNRNSEPYFTDALRAMHDDGHTRILAIVTSAYSSYSGCRQYRENLYQALVDTSLLGEMSIDKVRAYFDHPGFVEPVVEALDEALTRMRATIPADDIRVLFATHSIPNVMGETSGPPALRDQFAKPGGAYEAQHLVAAGAIIDRLRENESPKWELVYQSRSGAPTTPWLEPDVNDAIARCHEEGVRGVIVAPIGFVSDHVEVVWDLDNEARETANALGLEFARVPTVGVHPAFVDGLADLVLERTANGEAKALSELGPWPGACAVGCCANTRRDLPVIAEASTTE